ncbi:S-layer glycoprotein N-glycosyltransferase AglJ [Methanoplanus sp. FWC-SCC4]|uniref:S-layer glycoprotein N-glycosyltransferase AglJ n=1 Tax=Methanochimaera problematica TaxID=2609417 RepID=A0AA97FCM4_9EURY|nr:S-layer glycoprotein N-glycosyltransferase AglJ [Methanoplanus sp. FWC-SCC4]WOF16067.1 S-layer glycoprotein N-glycosyltransferase AglJ [Methanoplanus sp. FWC-SCC4]
MDIKKDEVCIFIPTLNEAPTIGELVNSFKEMGYTHIFVMDGKSTDKTVKIAEESGAIVKIQTGKGKGRAIIEAIDFIQQPYILMLDGDGTYLPEDSEKMLYPLFNGFDHVIGNRLDTFEPGALSNLNHFGNQVINYLFKVAHGEYLHDILSGYRAFTLDSVKRMSLKENGFEIETEISVETIRNQQKVSVVEIQYKPRPGTQTKLHPVRDGAKIISAVWRLARVSNPIFYFGVIGLFVSLIGLIAGIYVAVEWFAGTTHTELALLTVLLIIMGFQIFMFGVIADMLVSFNRELRREIQRLRPPNPPVK